MQRTTNEICKSNSTALFSLCLLSLSLTLSLPPLLFLSLAHALSLLPPTRTLQGASSSTQPPLSHAHHPCSMPHTTYRIQLELAADEKRQLQPAHSWARAVRQARQSCMEHAAQLFSPSASAATISRLLPAGWEQRWQQMGHEEKIIVLRTSTRCCNHLQDLLVSDSTRGTAPPPTAAVPSQ